MYRAIVTPIWWFLGIQYALKVCRRPNLQLLLEKILRSNKFWSSAFILILIWFDKILILISNETSSAFIYLQSLQQLDLQKMHGTRTRTRTGWFISQLLNFWCSLFWDVNCWVSTSSISFNSKLFSISEPWFQHFYSWISELADLTHV